MDKQIVNKKTMDKQRACAWMARWALVVVGCVANGTSAAEMNVDQASASERELMSIPTADRLAAWHALKASTPHPAASAANRELAERLRNDFRAMGLEANLEAFYPYLPEPVSAELEIVGPDRVQLAIREGEIETDQLAGDPAVSIGWNAYSGSGDIASRVVYANYATPADFERLDELGVDVEGAIVIARYGRNYRGLKATLAEAAGAAGLIMYSDPRDTGYARGLEWPRGGWAGPKHIQRGSVLWLDYPGDPLTPGVFAGERTDRLDPASVAMPTIPVQPIGYGAAEQILSRMTGQAVPRGWQGGLPFVYRVEGGPELRVRLAVEQRREIRECFNIIAGLEGATRPEEMVIIGGHFDAWTFGAGDPHAGTICLMEVARAFAERAQRGDRPDRSIVFALWDAEEHGIIGSTEWVERYAETLSKRAVAYINLDMSAMGPQFRVSASPGLRSLIVEAAKVVPQAGADDGRSVYEDWLARGEDPLFDGSPRIGRLGGGSDHVAFWCNLGIESVGMGGGGSEGVSYHGAADHLAWYHAVVGDDYEPALMITRMVAVVASRLADVEHDAMDPKRAYTEARRTLREVSELWIEAGRAQADPFGGVAGPLAGIDAALAKAAERAKPGEPLAWRITRLDAQGPVRPFYRNIIAATAPNDGYGVWTWPGLRHAARCDLDDDEVRKLLASIERQIDGAHRD